MYEGAIICETPQGTFAAGQALAAALSAGAVLGLAGALGAGKTQFVKGLAEGLGLGSDVVTSPTFALWHEYRAADGGLSLYHGDFYRLENEAEAVATGLEEYLDGDGVTVIEWADKFPSLLPERTIWRSFQLDGSRRVITPGLHP